MHLPNSRLARSRYESQISSALSPFPLVIFPRLRCIFKPRCCPHCCKMQQQQQQIFGAVVTACMHGNLRVLPSSMTVLPRNFSQHTKDPVHEGFADRRKSLLKPVVYPVTRCHVVPVLVKENQSRPWQPMSSINDLEEQGPEWDGLRIMLLAISVQFFCQMCVQRSHMIKVYV